MAGLSKKPAADMGSFSRSFGDSLESLVAFHEKGYAANGEQATEKAVLGALSAAYSLANERARRVMLARSARQLREKQKKRGNPSA